MSSEILKGAIDIIILSLITEKDMYGYDIAKKIKENSNNFYQIAEGTLYPALRRLEQKSYIQSFWKVSEEGTNRKYYKITCMGMNELQIRLETWIKIDTLIKKCKRGK